MRNREASYVQVFYTCKCRCGLVMLLLCGCVVFPAKAGA